MRRRYLCTALLAAVLSGVLVVVWGASGDTSALASAGVADARSVVTAESGVPARTTGPAGGATCDPEAASASGVAVSPTDAIATLGPSAGHLDAASGATGTTPEDLADFAAAYESVRTTNCLEALPADNVRYDPCLEQYLFWIAGDPSPDPLSAWGHKGEVVRSDGLAPVGCDGNLAGGSHTTGRVAADKWWASAPHRLVVYQPEFRGDVTRVCVGFAAVHGGAPDESPDFVRSASRWYDC